MNVVIKPPPWATHILSDLSDWERRPQVLSGALRLDLPNDVYFEYAFLDADGQQRPDPNNSTWAQNPWYPAARAIIGPAYKPDPYAEPDEALGRGRVQRHRLNSQALGQLRRITVYTPKAYEHQALPCILVQDGVAYYRIGKLHLVLEALLAKGLVRPAHLVFIEPTKREKDYLYNPKYGDFLVQELLPLLKTQLRPSTERILMGASSGALASATIALKHPDLFQAVIAQSGAFLGTPEEPDVYQSKRSWLLAELIQRDALPLRWYSDCGTLEWLTDINRRLAEVLTQKGYDHCYRERSAGHNWMNWRNGLGSALRFVLSQDDL